MRVGRGLFAIPTTCCRSSRALLRRSLMWSATTTSSRSGSQRISRALHGASLRRARSRSKKTAHAAEQDRADVRAAREAWFEGQLDRDPLDSVKAERALAGC